MKHTKFYTMPLDDLWKLHDEVISALASRIEAQKSELEKRLEQLGTRFGGSPRDIRIASCDEQVGSVPQGTLAAFRRSLNNGIV